MVTYKEKINDLETLKRTVRNLELNILRYINLQKFHAKNHLLYYLFILKYSNKQYTNSIYILKFLVSFSY